jgi:hypothetical protein
MTSTWLDYNRNNKFGRKQKMKLVAHRIWTLVRTHPSIRYYPTLMPSSVIGDQWVGRGKGRCQVLRFRCGRPNAMHAANSEFKLPREEIKRFWHVLGASGLVREHRVVRDQQLYWLVCVGSALCPYSVPLISTRSGISDQSQQWIFPDSLLVMMLGDDYEVLYTYQ